MLIKTYTPMSSERSYKSAECGKDPEIIAYHLDDRLFVIILDES